MTITEVSNKYGFTADTLRYYERIGLIPPVNRNKNGIRNFTKEDCGWVEFAKCMRLSGIQVEAIVEYVALYHKGDETRNARKQILLEQRTLLVNKMEEMRTTLNRLNEKIDWYEKTVMKVEKEQTEL